MIPIVLVVVGDGGRGDLRKWGPWTTPSHRFLKPTINYSHPLVFVSLSGPFGSRSGPPPGNLTYCKEPTEGTACSTSFEHLLFPFLSRIKPTKSIFYNYRCNNDGGHDLSPKGAARLFRAASASTTGWLLSHSTCRAWTTARYEKGSHNSSRIVSLQASFCMVYLFCLQNFLNYP